MSGIIYRGSPKHNEHLKSVELEKIIDDLKPSPVLFKEEGKPDPNSGPTVEAFVAAGKNPKDYPPAGYNSKSTDIEIANAIFDYKAKPEVKPAPVKPEGDKKPTEIKQ